MERVVFSHLSDAHIGRQLFENEFHRRRPLNGYNPHDERLLEPLYAAIQDARILVKLAKNEPMAVVFSGDLTCGGTDNDFAIARALFFRRWLWKFAERRGGRRYLPPRDVGFGWREGDVFMAPGNHDHWRHRYSQNAYDPSVGKLFLSESETPWSFVLESQNGTLRVELFFVDSNSGLLGQKWNIEARGVISDDEFIGLKSALEQSIRQEYNSNIVVIRAFVCHHGFSAGDIAGWFALPTPLRILDKIRFQPLSVESRQLLHYLSCCYRVPIALTGHTHEFFDHPWTNRNVLNNVARALERLGWSPPNDFSSDWPLYELRAAACLAGPSSPHQGFYVHEIQLGTEPWPYVRWSVRTYQQREPGEFIVDSDEGKQLFEMSSK
jgi:hypothetical protein